MRCQTFLHQPGAVTIMRAQPGRNHLVHTQHHQQHKRQCPPSAAHQPRRRQLRQGSKYMATGDKESCERIYRIVTMSTMTRHRWRDSKDILSDVSFLRPCRCQHPVQSCLLAHQRKTLRGSRGGTGD